VCIAGPPHEEHSEAGWQWDQPDLAAKMEFDLLSNRLLAHENRPGCHPAISQLKSRYETSSNLASKGYLW
jgi:hypothetical protein